MLDRSTSTVTSKYLVMNGDGSIMSPTTSVLAPAEDNKTRFDMHLYEVQGNGSAKVEMFKTQCIKLLKAI